MQPVPFCDPQNKNNRFQVMHLTAGGPVPVKMNGSASKELSSGIIELLDLNWFCKLVQLIH